MSTWIRRFHAAPEAEVQLVCFPHAGGTASTYHPLSALLGGAVETLAVQYPGRHDRHGDAWAREVARAVDAVVSDLRAQASPHRRLALFGHSMGSVLAFETARRLERDGRTLAGVFVSGRHAPAVPWPPPGAPAPHELDDRDLVREVRMLSGTPEEVLNEPELLRLALPVLRADYRMLAAYAYEEGPKLECPIVALTGDSDPRVGVSRMREWERETNGRFELHVFPGGHFYLHDQLPQVVKAVTDALIPSGVGR
ncbi:alpha/beta fold hydrolase [Streptomyces sp. NPDC046805]|uniref:thioesterase II family protein n=1 Tax=Streptomyces sp. NPDC046805 TaxID=3155134 RepID=UPI0033C9BBC2